MYVTLCPGSVNVACKLDITGLVLLSISAFVALNPVTFVFSVGVISSSTTLVLLDEKSTLKLDSLGITSADDSIFSVLENAA